MTSRRGGLYSVILQLRLMGYSDAEIKEAMSPNKIVFTPGQFEEEIRKAGLGPIMLWDDVGYWMHPAPRPLGTWADFAEWVFNGV